MSALFKFAVATAAVHTFFLLLVMYRMSAGGLLKDPIAWVIAGWVIAPTAFVAWRACYSKVWAIALFPMIIFGTYEAYIMGYVSTSSTTAIGLLFLPFYEWAFAGIIGVVKLLAET